MVSLLDTNVLIALAWPSHVHHGVARAWFLANRDRGWATCPQTQAAFIRVSSNRKVLPDACSPREALAVLRRIVAQPHHLFWTDDIALATSEHIDETRLLGHQQVTDLHLLTLAIRHGGSLATLDRGVRDLVPRAVDASVVRLLTER